MKFQGPTSASGDLEEREFSGAEADISLKRWCWCNISRNGVIRDNLIFHDRPVCGLSAASMCGASMPETPVALTRISVEIHRAQFHYESDFGNDLFSAALRANVRFSGDEPGNDVGARQRPLPIKIGMRCAIKMIEK
ncbi:hypothetical protein [Jiella flava]|uniref:Uncharacterized protein n=1 Tax=Jiella flava TaxID=2816857 RepID=A0A939JV78_9HYPH|nr:hypothetical protein [Jiella flava]MBO0660996.1 hypothetical protein [Jiella flava]